MQSRKLTPSALLTKMPSFDQPTTSRPWKCRPSTPTARKPRLGGLIVGGLMTGRSSVAAPQPTNCMSSAVLSQESPTTGSQVLPTFGPEQVLVGAALQVSPEQSESVVQRRFGCVAEGPHT